MVGLAYASVPLYDLFCRVTGFGGTTQVATAESDRMLDRVVTVRFDSNVNPALSWKFEPVQRSMDLQIGETGLAFYRATNTRSEEHTSELQSLMRISYAVFCLKKKTTKVNDYEHHD